MDIAGAVTVVPAGRYRYRAARADGGFASGIVEAATESQAVAVLIGRGLHPVRLEPADPAAGRRRPAPRHDLAIAFRAIAALVDAGVPVERAIAAAEPLARGPLAAALADARRLLREGRTLASALDAANGVVPPVITGMIRAGEHGGRLPATLSDVADHLEQEAELIARVRQALAYPALVAVAGTVSIAIIGIVVMPRFAAVLGDLGQALPPATRLLLAISGFFARYGLVLCAAALAGCAALAAWRRTPRGRLAFDSALLGLPILGSVRHALATARVARSLGLLLDAGMPLLPALDAAAEAAGDAAVTKRIRAARERVAEGQPLAASLEHAAALTQSARQLVAVGEGTGRLGPMATRAGRLAAQEGERALRTAVGLIEPLLIVLFGGLVAFVALALLQAVYGLRPMGV
jgi:general secretion pathway protein F